MKGLASTAGNLGEAIDTGSPVPSKEQCSITFLTVSCTCQPRPLHLSSRLFRNNKHPVGELLVADELAERLMTVTDVNKAALQLTGNNSWPKSRSNPKHFFCHVVGADVRS